MHFNVIKLKKVITSLLISAMMFSIVIPVQSTNAKEIELTDIGSHWGKKQITSWLSKGLIEGYPDNTFKPDNNITRAEFATLVNKAFKFNEKAAISFSDVSSKQWFYSEIAKASKAGYLKGYQDGTMKPNEPITRQEVAVVITRLKSLEENKDGTKIFIDEAKIAKWSKGAVGAVAKEKCMEGYPDRTFRPTKNITRAEALIVLDNILYRPKPASLIDDNENILKETVKINDIQEQKINVYGVDTKIDVKTDPEDAEVSIENSDDTILKATLNNNTITLDGLEEGTATITVIAKKDGFEDGKISFIVEVEKVYYGGGSSHKSKSNSKPTITVTEPDGTNDGLITLLAGSTFIPPTVTANDAEDGDITSSIVKNGEDKVDTSKIGEYTITYNVKDSKNLAANEKIVVVKVIANNDGFTDETANITVNVSKDLPAFKQIIVNTCTVGTQFKVEGIDVIRAIGGSIEAYTSQDTLEVSILDADGKVLGKISVDVSTSSTKDYIFKVKVIEKTDETANITVNVSQVLPAFKQIIVNTCTAGTQFKAEGIDVVRTIGGSIEAYTSQDTLEVSILDADGKVLGKISVDVSASSTKDYIFKVEEVEEKDETANITVNVSQVLPAFKQIIVNTCTVGTQFKVEGIDVVRTIGGSIEAYTSQDTLEVSILDVNGTELGKVSVDVSTSSTSDYELVQG